VLYSVARILEVALENCPAFPSDICTRMLWLYPCLLTFFLSVKVQVQITGVYLLVNSDPTAEQAVSLDCVVCWSKVFISQVCDSEITKQYYTVPSESC